MSFFNPLRIAFAHWRANRLGAAARCWIERIKRWEAAATRETFL